MKALRAIFIERSVELADVLKPHYQAFFEGCGYEVVFADADGEGQARKLIDSFDPHIIVCDLGWDREWDGFHTIRELRKSYPDLFVIGTSRNPFDNKIFDSRQPSFHMFIDKQELLGGVRAYAELMRNRFLESFKIETDVFIANLDKLRSDEWQKIQASRQLTALIRQIMFSGHKPDPLMHPDEITLEPMSGGFSSSYVFKMIARNSKSGIVCVPSVVKISPREYAQQELDNYHRFVKWGIPYTWRVDLLGYGETKNYGAVAYSFILSESKKFEPLTELLRRRLDDKVTEVVDTLFSPEMRRWYGDQLIRPQANLVERYVNRYFRGAESKALSEKTFLSLTQSCFGAQITGNKISIAGESFDLPLPALFGWPIVSYQSCICHGDMNSNNVMVAENDQLIFIDFQETGRGHVFEDFVTMEASVRLYYGEDSLKGVELLRAEQALREGDDVAGLQGVQRIAANIRRLAKRNFSSEGFHSYYYANAAFHFRLLRMQQLSSGQKERTVAAILASLGELGRFRRSAGSSRASRS